MTLAPPRQKNLAPPLLKWFDRHKRPMPWRETTDPYAIWLSETMLQQTQVATVIPYYHRFLKRFPTVTSLAAADLQDVLSLWAGLGYYRRAKHLHAAAKEIVALHAGHLPKTADALATLPGVGRYTAGAVASIAFQQRTPVLDGNVMRVLTRLFAISENIALPATQKKLWSLAETLVPANRPGDFNQALMELGATICTPQNPQCPLCPLRTHCQAAAAGIQSDLPVKTKRAPNPTIRRIALVLIRASSLSKNNKAPHDEILLMQRPPGVLWEQMWEFPALEMTEKKWPNNITVGGSGGGAIATKTKSGFNWRAQIADEVQQRLGIRVELEPWHGAIGHQLTHRTLDYRILRGRIRESTCDLKLPVCDGARYQAFRWIRWADALTTGLPMGRISTKIATAADIA